MENVSIRRLIERLTEGQIRIPAFQRGYVWDADDVAFLMDTIFRGFPFGTLLFWRTAEQLAKERTLGPFTLPEPKTDYPIDYVLDGQQRLTSLYGVFNSDLPVTTSSTWFDIYFDLRAPEGALEEQFVALPADKVEPERHFSLRTLFEPVAYRAATAAFDNDTIRRLDLLQAKFKEALIPVETIEVTSREDVAIIFERINRAGVELTDFELLSAWTWSTEFDLRDSFQELAAEVESFGFGEIDGDPNLLIKCCAAVIRGDASAKTVVDLHGPTVRDRFDEVRTGVLGAIDFLKKQLNVEALRVMPYPAMIVPLAAFFATTNRAGIHANANQLAQLKRWFWRSSFSRRYSSSVNTAHKADIAALGSLKANPAQTLPEFPCDIDDRFFTGTPFNVSSVNTKTFILLLAHLRPRSLLSGAIVDLERVLRICNRTEFHHIFPQKFLERLGTSPADQNVLANLCFLSNADNQTIKDKDPKAYEALIPAPEKTAVLKSNVIPLGGLQMDYPQFVASRDAELKAIALTLID